MLVQQAGGGLGLLQLHLGGGHRGEGAGLVQLHLGGGHRGEGAGLVQQARPLLAQLGLCEGGLEHGGEGLQLVRLALRVGGAHFGGGGGVLGGGGWKWHHRLHFLQQYEQLRQLLLWQAHVESICKQFQETLD